MQIVYKKVSELIPYVRNNKIHSERQIKLIAASIQEFGFTQPIVVDNKNSIIIGHARVEAGKLAKLEEVPCYVASELSKAQIKSLRIADNKLSSLAEWDNEMLALELQELKELDFNLELTGFDNIELNDFLELDTDTEITEDEVPEVDETKPAYSKLGDLWLLGRHRLLCGDSTDKATVERLMDGKKADMLLTDPPYNVDYVGKTKDTLKIDNDKMSNSNFREFLTAAFAAANNVLKAGGVFYVWHADLEGYNFRGACFDVGWQVRQCLIWNKNCMVMGRQDYHWKHEPCLYGWKEGAGHLWATDRKQTTVIDFQRPSRNAEHPTMKPIGLFDYQIKNNTKGEDIVLDLFLGSGTTIIACQQNGRIGYGLELDEKYIDVIVKRYNNLGKDDITLIRDGKEYKWEDIKNELIK